MIVSSRDHDMFAPHMPETDPPPEPRPRRKRPRSTRLDEEVAERPEVVTAAGTMRLDDTTHRV